MRTLDEMRWMKGFIAKHRDTLDCVDMYEELHAHFRPPAKPGSGIDILQDVYDRLGDFLDNLEPNRDFNLKEVMAAMDLDPDNRSDQINIRKFLNENKLLQHVPKRGEVWRKQIAHKPNGESPGKAAAD